MQTTDNRPRLLNSRVLGIASLALGLAVAAGACSSRPTNPQGGSGGTGTGGQGAGGLGAGGLGAGGLGAGGLGAGGLGAGGTGGVIGIDDPSCQGITLTRKDTLTPTAEEAAEVTSMINQLQPAERIAMLSGGDEIPAPNKYKIDFNGTGSATIGIPDFEMRDGPRGVHLLPEDPVKQATTWAVAEARAASFDLDLEYRVGKAQGAEMVAYKFELSLAPTLNVLRHPGWGRAQETYGEDTVLVGEMAAAFVNGMQADYVMQACPKHFAVNNTENNRHDMNAVIDEQTLREVYLKNFQIVIEKSDPACIMAAYNLVNGYQAPESAYLLTNVLRTDWQWKGFVVSDWWATEPNNGSAALNAGLDYEMPDNQAFKTLPTELGGSVTIDRINEALGRSLTTRVKFKTHTQAWKDSPFNTAIIENQTHKDLARETAEKGAVLLKNDNILPLGAAATTVGKGTPAVGSIVFLGPDALLPNAQTTTTAPSGLGDRGSSNTFPPYAWSFIDGLKAHPLAAGITITSSANAADASTADIAIIPVTMGHTDEGEGFDSAGMGADRVDLTLGGTHPKHWGANKASAFIQAAAQANPNVIVLLANGSAVVLEDWLNSAKGIVQTFYPGQEGGIAVARLLLGEINFSAKLPFTVATSEADYPIFNNNGAGDKPIDYWHGYRKIEFEGKTPRFWFGYGQSYTTYEYSDVTVLCSSVAQTGALNLAVDVTNTGAMAGDEIVQVYIGYPAANGARRAKKELKAFTRVNLQPGEKKTVQFSVPARDMAMWVEGTGWVVEPGAHTVYVGPSADPLALKSATFTIN